jgi:hypothetical protein
MRHPGRRFNYRAGHRCEDGGMSDTTTHDLKSRLQGDLTDAIRARDELRAATLRMALTAVKSEEVSGKVARELSDAEVLTVLGREA